MGCVRAGRWPSGTARAARSTACRSRWPPGCARRRSCAASPWRCCPASRRPRPPSSRRSGAKGPTAGASRRRSTTCALGSRRRRRVRARCRSWRRATRRRCRERPARCWCRCSAPARRRSSLGPRPPTRRWRRGSRRGRRAGSPATWPGCCGAAGRSGGTRCARTSAAGKLYASEVGPIEEYMLSQGVGRGDARRPLRRGAPGLHPRAALRGDAASGRAGRRPGRPGAPARRAGGGAARDAPRRLGAAPGGHDPGSLRRPRTARPLRQWAWRTTAWPTR